MNMDGFRTIMFDGYDNDRDAAMVFMRLMHRLPAGDSRVKLDDLPVTECPGGFTAREDPS